MLELMVVISICVVVVYIIGFALGYRAGKKNIINQLTLKDK